MSLATRLARLELALLSNDREPVLLVVIEERDGTWQLNGVEIDKTTVDPRTRVIVFSERADGQQ